MVSKRTSGLALGMVLAVALLLSACGGGGDEAAIEQTVREFFAVFDVVASSEQASADLVRDMQELSTDDCPTTEEEYARFVATVLATEGELGLDVVMTGVRVRNLYLGSAQATVQGTIRGPGGEVELPPSWEAMVREDGQWKFGTWQFDDCGPLLFGFLNELLAEGESR